VVALNESLVVVGLKTEHKLTKCYNFHFSLSFRDYIF
jgi:hypothetical protein